MRRTLCLLPFLLAAPVYCAEESTLVDLLPSGSQIVFGIKVHSVLNSELARNLTAEMNGQAAEWQKMIALSGFDPFNDLEEVLIASTGAAEKAPTLIVARGKFDVEKLTPNAEIYNGVRLVTSQNAQAPGVYGFLDEATAIAGDPETVKATIDHRSEPAHLDGALASQIANYRQRYDVWAVVNRADGLAKYVPKSSGAAAAGLDSIDHFQFGLSMAKGLELAAEVHARTAKDAEQLATTLQFLDAMTKASQQNGAPGTKFAYKNEDGTLKISLAVSEEELKKTIETQRKAGLMLGTRPAQARPKTAEVAPPVSAQPVLPTVAAEQPLKPAAAAPKPAPATPKPASPTAGPDDGRTAVFTLPSRP